MAGDETAENDLAIEHASWWSMPGWLRWKPTSPRLLKQTEEKILNCIKCTVERCFVPIYGGEKRIWTLKANTHLRGMPIVLVHGMGAGIGLWALNIDHLSEKRPLYAFDVLGFGQSSRPSFSKHADIAENEFIDAIEKWREALDLKEFILLGHSLGAYLSCAYTIKYPQRVRHLILADPWGFPEKPVASDRESRIPVWIRLVARLLMPFNPLASVRVAGPWGPGLVKRFRPDLQRMFSGLFDDDTIFEYIYHCNAQPPSGETAFRNMTMSFGWAKNPMVTRITDIEKDIPISMLYGSRSWIDRQIGYNVKYLRNDSYVDVQVIKGAGHHVYADKPKLFNNMVSKICSAVDSETDTKMSESPFCTRARPIFPTEKPKSDLSSVQENNDDDDDDKDINSQSTEDEPLTAAKS